MTTLSIVLLGCLFCAFGVHAADWQLVWSDEFDYTGLPDKAKWDYEEGFLRNKESQYYTRARLENARVENGTLIIECRKEHFQPANHAPVEYTAASLVTRHKASWQYGRIEMRAKLPQGKGVWPAFWTMGDKGGWPAGGEIDIMEFVGKEPGFVHGTVHYAGPDGKHRSNGDKLSTARPFDDFHIYAVEWFPDHIDFFFDQKKYFTFNVDLAGAGPENAFRKPHYLLLNFALGGSWGGEIDDSILPSRYVVDYVRVYQQKK